MRQYSFKMLGPFGVESMDDEIALPSSRKARSLLAYLAMNRRGVSKDHLVEWFFAETQDPKGGLRWAISRLRAALDREFVVTNSTSVALDASRYSIDIETSGIEISSETSVANLTKLESGIRGEFLADLCITKIAEFEAWRLAQQIDCANRHALLLQAIITKSLGTMPAVEYARKLVNLDATRESAWALLVKSLLSMDQLNDARQIQRLAVEQLEREGIRLTGLLEKVWQVKTIESVNTIVPSSAAGSNVGFKPRVAILACESPKSIEAHLANRLTEVVFRACNVNKTVTVMAPTISTQLSSTESDMMAAAHDFGVDFLINSKLSRKNGLYFAEVNLVEVDSGGCLFRWSKSLPQADIEESLEAYLAARMEIDLPIALISRVREKPAEQLTARDLYLLALPRMFSADGFDPVEAHELLERALSLQPYFGQACCALSLIRMFMPQCNDNDTQLNITLSLARRSVEICQDDAFVLGIAAATISHAAKDTETGMDLARRALSINPYSVMAGISAAMVHHYHGDDKACIAYIDAVEANSDTEPVSFFCHTCRAMAHYQLKEYEDALKWSRKAVGHNPTFVIALRYLLASLAQLGAMDEASALAKKISSIDPSENVAFFKRRSAYRLDRSTDHLCEGLRKGNLPETA